MKRESLHLLRCVAAGAMIGSAAAPTAALTDLITLFLPGIKGDVKAKGQEGTVEVLSLSNDLLNPLTGRIRCSDMVIHKLFDRASPELFLALVQLRRFTNAVITFLRPNADSLTKVFTITLTNVLIVNFMTDAAESNVTAGPEQINLNYASIQLKDEATGEQASFDCVNLR